VTEKTCPKCETAKPPEDFARNRVKKDGLQVYCRACLARWRAENRSKIRAAAAAFRAENVTRIRAEDAAYRAANRDAILARRRARYLAQKEA
jgi:RNase P subunit RPR2